MNYRDIRAKERSRYLEVNGAKLLDSEKRWDDYERLIVSKFGPGRVWPPARWDQAIDYAWEARDVHNTRASKGNNKRPHEANTAMGHGGLPNERAKQPQ